jgi:hypothetical protein
MELVRHTASIKEKKRKIHKKFWSRNQKKKGLPRRVKVSSSQPHRQTETEEEWINK